nr:SRPBCC domain-containing protein [Nonomuraea pusilla]
MLAAGWRGTSRRRRTWPGGVFAVDIDGNPIRGEFVEVDRPRTVVVTWGLEGDDVLPAGSTEVAFRLTPTATGTRVDLTHSNLPESQVPPHAEGWPHFLGILAETAAATAAA